MSKNNKDEKNEEKSTSSIAEKSLFDSRTVFVFGEINMDLAKQVTANLIALAHVSKDPINMIINSPGGHVESGYTIYDMIKFIDAPVNVIGTGWVASSGALIYLGAEKNRRFSLPNTRYLLHQPIGGMQGAVTDVEIQADQIMKMWNRLNKLIAKETNKDIKQIEIDTDRDYWLSAEEAVEYGIVRKIITSLKDLKSTK